LADSASTKGLSTKGVLDGRVSSIESSSCGWLVVESTNGSLGVGLISEIFNLESIGGLSSVLFKGEGNVSNVSHNTFSLTNSRIS
jgi:hypothetical protein